MTAGLSIDDPAYFDRLADVEARHWWSIGVWQMGAYWLDSALEGRSGLKVLDVGCGTGQTVLRLASRDEIQDVIGLDPNPHALRHARTRHAFPLVQGSALELPFEADSLDLVTCFDVLQHLEPGHDMTATLEIARVLKPGGLTLIRTNGRGWSGDASTYRLDSLIAMIEGSGLIVRRGSPANVLPALAQEIRGTLNRHWRLDPNQWRMRSHPSGGGLQIRVPSAGWNQALGIVSQTEAWIAGRLRLPLPFGHSTLVLAEAPG